MAKKDKSTLRGYLSWIAVTVFFLGMGIVSKAMTVTLQGVPTDLINQAAPFVTVGAVIVVASTGWRGKMDDYEPWEGVLVVAIPFFVLAGYVPQFATILSDSGTTLFYNWGAWIASSTIIWILSKAN